MFSRQVGMVSRLGAKSSVDKTDDGGLKRDFKRK